jgi:hypothetical protein
MRAGIHIYGKYATIVFGGSFINTLIGPGSERIPTKKTFATSKNPAAFHINAIIFGHVLFVKQK